MVVMFSLSLNDANVQYDPLCSPNLQDHNNYKLIMFLLLMALNQLQRLLTTEWNNIIIYGEMKRTGKEAVLPYFKVLSWHSL